MVIDKYNSSNISCYDSSEQGESAEKRESILPDSPNQVSVDFQGVSFGKNNYSTEQYVRYQNTVFTQTSLIHLQEMGFSKALSHKSCIISARNAFLFLIVSGGRGNITQNNNSYDLTEGDGIFLDCKKEVIISSSEDLFELHWIFFYGPNMKAIFEYYIEHGGMQIFHLEEPEVYITHLKGIYDEAFGNDFLREMKIYERLVKLLVMLIGERCIQETASDYNQSRSKKQDLQEVKEYLDQNYRSKITLDSLAEKFFINKFYLARIYKEQFGTSITSYLLKVRVMHARQLLRYTDMPIEKIGHECGINDANYFSRMFKKEEGISPGEFRKKGRISEL